MCNSHRIGSAVACREQTAEVHHARINPLIIASSMTFVIYAGSFMRNPIIPLYAKDLGATVIEVGIISSSFMVVASLLAIPLGSTSDRLGRRRLAIVGSLLVASSSLLMTLATSPTMIMLFYALAGLGLACYSPAVTAFVGDISRTDTLGKVYGTYTMVQQTAIAMGPAVGGVISGLLGFRNVFGLSGVVVLVGSAVGLLYFHGSSEARPKATRPSISKGFNALRRSTIVLMSWVSVFTISFMWGVSQTFLPIYAETVGVGVVLIGILFGVQSATNAIGRIPLGALFDRLGRKWVIMVVGVAFEALGTALMVYFSAPVMLGILMVLIGFGMGVTQMAASALISEASNQTTRGLGMGFYYTCFYGGMAVSPTALGLVISAFGFAPGFLAAAVVGLAAILIIIALTYRASSQAAP